MATKHPRAIPLSRERDLSSHPTTQNKSRHKMTKHASMNSYIALEWIEERARIRSHLIAAHNDTHNINKFPARTNHTKYIPPLTNLDKNSRAIANEESSPPITPAAAPLPSKCCSSLFCSEARPIPPNPLSDL